MTHSKIQGKFYSLQNQEWVRAYNKLKSAEQNVLYFIKTLDLFGKSPIPKATEMVKVLKIDKGTVSRALKVLGQKQYIDWRPSNKERVEQLIRDPRFGAAQRLRLQSELGGQPEVATLAGRIDLLTDLEVIKVKAVEDWKSSVGQVLAYSGFYLEHQKYIHLFARPGDTSSEYTLLQTSPICNGLRIAVTFEEVQL